ncbi:hypothetical protein [Methylomonas sp. AM2-LC]|uniref:hypothetical protein n=1 Tax=Methylomonas sp. AM2-LC TaxID=3153301 RepID=UPI0032651F28
MLLIIKNLCPCVQYEEIENFLAPALKKRLFRKVGTIEDIKIIQLISKEKKIIKRNAIIRVSNKPAEKIVKLLKEKIGGNQHLIEIYHTRIWSNDRRFNLDRFYPEDRRQGERRRYYLKSK